MKLYKFYKKGCPPCYSLSRILKTINIPESIDVINVDTAIESNKELINIFDIDQIPALVFENGEQLIGMHSKLEIEQFLRKVE